MAIVPASDNIYTGDGTTTQFAIGFHYLKENDVAVSIDEVLTAFTFATPGIVNITPAPASGAVVRVFRNTDATEIPYVFSDGVPFLTRYADFNWQTLLYVFQEAWAEFKNNSSNFLKTLRTADNLNPITGDRANKLLGFDADGQPTALLFTPESVPVLDARLTAVEQDLTIVQTFIAGIYNIFARSIDSVAALNAYSPVVGQIVNLTSYYSGLGLGGGKLVTLAGVITPNNITTFASANPSLYYKRINYDFISAEMGGARGDGITNDLPRIQAIIDTFPLGQRILLPGAQYRITGTLYMRYQGIYLEGAGVYATELIYDAVGGTMIKANAGTTIINSAGISKMTLRGATPTNSPDVVVDLSGFSYCSFKELELVNSRSNGKIWSGYSDLGTAPYFNLIDDFTMFGGGDNTQTGFSFTAGAWSGGSRGANANIISNLKRAAGMKTLFDIQDGQGNIFSNIVGESINTDFIKLNDVPSYADTGTITGFTQNTLTDTSKSWPVSPDQLYTNYSVVITGGVGAGQCRHIASHSANTLVLSSPWGIALQAGSSTYAIVRFGAVDNIFSNVRQEGNGGNFVKCLPGAIGNRVSDAVVSGVVTVVNDLSGDPTNHLSNGDLVMLHEVIKDIGPSANLDVWPRSSVLGGLPVGRLYSIEFLQVNCPGIISGTATVTLDSGGVSVGTGSPTVRCVLDSNLNTGTISSPVNKSAKNSANNNLFLNISTSAAMNPTTDFVITIGLRVH